MTLEIFKPGDEFQAGEHAALVESWAAYGGMLPSDSDEPATPVVVVDLEALVPGIEDRAHSRLIFTEQAAHDLLHGLQRALALLANLRNNQEGPQ